MLKARKIPYAGAGERVEIFDSDKWYGLLFLRLFSHPVQKLDASILNVSGILIAAWIQVEGQDPAAHCHGRRKVAVRALGERRVHQRLAKGGGRQDSRLPTNALPARHGARGEGRR